MLNHPSRLRSGVVACVLVLTAACTDRQPLATDLPSPEQMSTVDCQADVQAQTLSCTAPVPATSRGARTNLIVGGQELYVRLANSGTSYDSGTQIFQTSVTVQNLLKQSLGTPDGATMAGLKVFFFTSPAVTSGTGTVEVVNPTGTELFMGSNQPYFLYPQILAPYEISAAQTWQFSVPTTANSFRFTVYVQAPAADESTSMLDRVWTGLVDALWTTPGNWKDGVAPDSSSVVGILADTLTTGPNDPVLAEDARVLHLRVGPGSTLGLGGFTMRADGNVDAVGPISNGTLWMNGSTALLRGTVNSLRVTGATRLQGAAKTTGAVTVQDGSLTAADQALTISIP